MDPASAAVVFIGFATSVVTLCGIVVQCSRTLYELQDRARNAPDELRSLYVTLKGLESMLVEIQRRSQDLDHQGVSPEFRRSWNTAVNLLETAVMSLRDWLTESFGSPSVGSFRRRNLLQKLKVFFADKKVETFRCSIDENINRLGFLRGLLISSQCRDLVTHYQIFPDLVSRLRTEMNSGMATTQKLVQGLRSDVSELCQTQLTTLYALESPPSYDRNPPVSPRSPPNRTQTWGSIANFLNCPRLDSRSQTTSSRMCTQEQILFMVCVLPIGVLHYRRSHRKSILKKVADSNVIDPIDEASAFSFQFIPASWISNVMVQLTLEIHRRRDRSRTLSVRFKDPARVCSDSKVLESLGLLYDEESRQSFRARCPIDPVAFRNHLLEGRVGPNDVISNSLLGDLSILEVVVANLLSQPKMAYQICEILLNNGARVDTMSSDHGTPLYIASGAGLNLVYNFFDTGSCKLYFEDFLGEHIFQPSHLDDVKSIQQLLLRHNAAFDLHLSYEDRTSWSPEHGWLPKLISLSSDPEYLRQALFDYLHIFEVQDFTRSDRWLIAILCYTYPTLRAALEARVAPVHRTRFRSFPAELELPTVLKQVEAASVEDRCFLIGSVCRFGTVAMLEPFLQGGFDLNECTKSKIHGLEHCHRSYFFQAAEQAKIDVMMTLATAGARLTTASDLLSIFNGSKTSKLCRDRDTMQFIDIVFAIFDFENCAEQRNILRRFFRVNYGVSSKFEDPLLAVSYLSTNLLQNGCFYARPPMSLNQILIPEVFQVTGCSFMPMTERKNWIRHFLDHFGTNLESTTVICCSFNKSMEFSVTILGLAVEVGELELMQLYLDAGASIEAPIADGRSALELAKENLRRAAEGTDRLRRWKKEEQVFLKLIEALKFRDLHDIADQAIIELRRYLTETVEESGRTAVQTISIFKRFCMILSYLSGQQLAPNDRSFHAAITRWTFNIRVITAISVDGIFVRFGFLFSLCFVIVFKFWTASKALILGNKSLLFVLRLVAITLLGVVIARSFLAAQS